MQLDPAAAASGRRLLIAALFISRAVSRELAETVPGPASSPGGGTQIPVPVVRPEASDRRLSTISVTSDWVGNAGS